jgi:hypothetical protein
VNIRLLVGAALAAISPGAYECAAQHIVDWVVHGIDVTGTSLSRAYDISADDFGHGVAVAGDAHEGTVLFGEPLELDVIRYGYFARSSGGGERIWSHRGLSVPFGWHGMVGYLVSVDEEHTYTSEGIGRTFDAGAREVGGQVIVAYDNAGEPEWVVALADSADTIGKVNAYVKALDVDGAGALYFGALVLDTFTIGGIQHVANGIDVAVASLNPDGSFRWMSTISGEGSQYLGAFIFDYAGAMDVAPSGRVAVAGYFPAGSIFGIGGGNETVTDVTSTGVALYSRTGAFLRVDLDCQDLGVCGPASAPRVAIGADHGVRTTWYFVEEEGQLEVDVGDTTFTDPGYGGAFVTSHDSTGQLLWATQFRGFGNEGLFSIDVDLEGNTYVAGRFDALEMTIGPNTTMRKSDLQFDEWDGFIVRLDSLGRVTWTMHMSGPGSQIINAIDVDDLGNVYFAAQIRGTAYIGSDVYHAGGTDWLHGKISVSTINSTEEPAVPVDRLAVYPNPARDYVNIEYPTVCRDARNVDAAVFDVLGRRVRNDLTAGPTVAGLRLDTRSLPTGLYVAAVTCDGERAAASFVVN